MRLSSTTPAIRWVGGRWSAAYPGSGHGSGVNTTSNEFENFIENDDEWFSDIELKVLDLEPNDWPSLNNMACLVAEQLNPPRPKEALQYSQKAYDVMLNSGGRNAFIYDTHGWVLTLNDRPQEGIDMLRQAVTLEPFFPESHYHLGEAYLRTKSPVEAQKQLELAAEQIRQAEDKKQAVSPGLSAKVDAALNKAKEIAKTKTANAAP